MKFVIKIILMGDCNDAPSLLISRPPQERITQSHVISWLIFLLIPSAQCASHFHKRIFLSFSKPRDVLPPHQMLGRVLSLDLCQLFLPDT